MTKKIFFEIPDDMYQLWLKELSNNDDNPQNALSIFVEQYLLFHRSPIEEYVYGIHCDEPQKLDFSKEPLKYIHPLKRAAIEKILLSDIPDSIDKIIVFGSAVTLHCHLGSDLDLCFVGKYRLRDEEERSWFKELSTQIGAKDVKTYTSEQLSHNFGVQYAINQTGVIIYDKNSIIKEPAPR